MRVELPQKGEIGEIVAGRRAGRKCVVLRPLDTRFVYVAYLDHGNLRKRVMNVNHVSLSGQLIKLESDADAYAYLRGPQEQALAVTRA